MFKISFLAKYYAIAVIAVGSVTFYACSDKSNPEPYQSSPTQSETNSFVSNNEPLEVLDDADDFSNARLSAISNPVTTVLKFANTCYPTASMKIYYRTGTDDATAKDVLPDTTRTRQFPKGTWKSFTIKPEKYGIELNKKFSNGLTYIFYFHNKPTKRAFKLGSIFINPANTTTKKTKVTNNIKYAVGCQLLQELQ